MTATQLWETTMDPEHRTLLQVKLEDIAETEAIFTTLMGEDVEARRKFIEDNALDVKNLTSKMAFAKHSVVRLKLPKELAVSKEQPALSFCAAQLS